MGTRVRFLRDTRSGRWLSVCGSVLEVLDGATVIEVARRFGVARQTVQVWPSPSSRGARRGRMP